MNGKKFFGILLIAFAGSIMGVVAFSLIVRPKTIIVQRDSLPPAQLTHMIDPAQPAPDFRLAAEKSVHAVVSVVTKSFVSQYGYKSMYDYFLNNPFERQIPTTGSGSGVIISPDGYIVTNNHVIEGSKEIEVTLNDGRVFDGELVGTDPSTDVAVIKVKAKEMPYLSFGNSDDLYVGDWVLAVGNPFRLQSTVTAGIVSAKSRNIGIIGNSRTQRQRPDNENNTLRTAIESFIQTDAAVNPGNSGGALVDLHGNLMGINTAIASQTGSYTGYSFAIPSAIAKKVVDDIIEFGEVQRAALGVIIESVDADMAKTKNLKVNQGSHVKDLSVDGGAIKAGIEIGDVIVEIDGRKIVTNADLMEQVSRHNPGDRLMVVVNRDGNLKEFKVSLGSLETENQTVGSVQFSTFLGAKLEKASDTELKKLRASGGVKVQQIQSGKLKSAGVPEGFIITRVNKVKVSEPQDIQAIMDQIESNEVVLFEGALPNGRYDYFTFRK